MSSNPSNMKKGSAYEKRLAGSIAAPLEVDSDSDFAPKPYIPTGTKKADKKSSTSPTTKRRKSRKEVLGVSKPRRNRVISRQITGPNPLLQYFGTELDLHSASEGESSPSDNERGEDVYSEDEEEFSGSEKESDSEVRHSRAAFSYRPSTPSATQLDQPTLASQENSATESDSGSESDSGLKRKSEFTQDLYVPSKRQKVAADVDDSATESDSGAEGADDFELSQATQPIESSSPPPMENTDTESDTEEEIDVLDTELHPRPGFQLGPGQVPQGPLVLDDDEDIKVPATINTYLRDYQRDGIQFFYKLYKEGRGGLLGDDMGKTIQVIGFLSAIMKKQGIISDKDRRRQHVSKLQDGEAWRMRRQLPPANATWPTCLIIAPSTVVHNWERELDTWGYFEVGLYNKSRPDREQILNDFKMGRLDVVVTTFDLARRDIDLIDVLPWSCIIVDEVHRVKNISAKITVAYHQFACKRRFGLTGTTIQNSYKEMWTILDWTNPGRLGTARQWQGFVVKPLRVGQSASATEGERAKGLAVAVTLKNKLLPNFFLRRTKDIIRNQLPQKTDQVVFCPLTPVQIRAYKHLLGMDAVQNLIHKDHACPCGSRKQRKKCCHPFVPGDVFRHMSILIKLSNHLGLILPAPTDTPEQTARNRALAEIAFPDGNIPKYGTALLQAQYCGKWAVLELLLKEWRKDSSNKILIFTKSVKLLEMLEFHLGTHGYGFLKLDGTTKQSERMPMIDKFHSDPKVFIFLISTLAGGTGLNLTGANKVVIFDPNWNPAHDLQAMDRAFRFGQTRDVSVYRLLGAGSVEELIYARQIYKQQQMAIGYDASIQTRYFQGIQGDSSKKGELFGIENIFKLHEDKLATKMAIEKATIAELDWALANIKSKRKTGDTLLIEADKGFKEEGISKGLGALLFDDALPVSAKEEDIIQKTLNAIGVAYSHHNDDILAPSRIEEERTKTTLRKRRQLRKSTGKSKIPKAAIDEPQWPPKRKHHKPPPTPEQQLAARQQALIELGMIKSPADIPIFALEFARQSKEAQEEILAELDKWTRT